MCPEEESEWWKACEGCVYLAKVTGGYSCDYILIVGTRRKCPLGEGCTRKIKGIKINTQFGAPLVKTEK